MPRKPNATSPNANTDGASINSTKPLRAHAIADRHQADDRQAHPEGAEIAGVKPDRMLSDAPPSRDADTISLTWPELVDVKIFTSSGMIAPASVPQVMIVDSFHHSVPSPRSRNQQVRRDVGDGDRNERREPDQRRERLFEIHVVGVRRTSRGRPSG